MATDAEKQQAYIIAISTSYPELPIRSARLHDHDGELNDILIVNDEWIFRFPRHAHNIPDLQREVCLLKRLQSLLPLPIPQPEFDSGVAMDHGQVFMGYRLLPGQPLQVDALEAAGNDSLMETLARQLAEFLSALHTLPPELLGMDLPILNMPDWTRSFFEEVRTHLFFYMRDDACQAVEDAFEVYFQTQNLYLYSPCLIHGDFGGSNILHDDHGATAVLDFTGASLSDPALDLASVSTYGEKFFTLICQSYPVTPALLERARFYRSLFALEEAIYGWKNGDEEAFSRGMEQYV